MSDYQQKHGQRGLFAHKISEHMKKCIYWAHILDISWNEIEKTIAKKNKMLAPAIDLDVDVEVKKHYANRFSDLNVVARLLAGK